MTIHPGDPFAPPPHERDAARRFRARIGGGVTLWTAGHGDGPRDRSGLTVSSLMTALGEPPHVLALLDPDAELTDALVAGGTAVVNLLSWRDRHLAEVFAGLAPAPGGRFVPDTWRDSSWGPVLAADAPGQGFGSWVSRPPWDGLSWSTRWWSTSPSAQTSSRSSTCAAATPRDPSRGRDRCRSSCSGRSPAAAAAGSAARRGHCH